MVNIFRTITYKKCNILIESTRYVLSCILSLLNFHLYWLKTYSTIKMLSNRAVINKIIHTDSYMWTVLRILINSPQLMLCRCLGSVKVRLLYTRLHIYMCHFCDLSCFSSPKWPTSTHCLLSDVMHLRSGLKTTQTKLMKKDKCEFRYI